MRSKRAVMDMNTLRIHFLGPGDYELESALPPGTETFQCEQSPSGHMVLPCCHYIGVDNDEAGGLDVGPDLSLPVITDA